METWTSHIQTSLKRPEVRNKKSAQTPQFSLDHKVHRSRKCKESGSDPTPVNPNDKIENQSES